MAYVDGVLVRGEEVVAIAKITKLVLIGAWIKGILLFWLLFIPTIKAIKTTIAVNKTELALTNQRLVGRKGIVARDLMDSKLDKVQTVRVEETFWGRIFKYANLVINTAGGTFMFLGIARANEFKQKVMNQIDEYEDLKNNKRANALAGAMKD